MKAYRGFRTDRGCVVLARNGKPLEPRTDVRNYGHGFEWGTSGPGPTQLALAILCDAIGEERAQELHEEFRDRVIAPIRDATWVLDEAKISRAIHEIEAEGKVEKRRPANPEIYDDLPF